MDDDHIDGVILVIMADVVIVSEQPSWQPYVFAKYFQNQIQLDIDFDTDFHILDPGEETQLEQSEGDRPFRRPLGVKQLKGKRLIFLWLNIIL